MYANIVNLIRGCYSLGSGAASAQTADGCKKLAIPSISAISRRAKVRLLKPLIQAEILGGSLMGKTHTSKLI